VATALMAASGSKSSDTPVTKVIAMLGDLHAKISQEGVQSKQIYEENVEFCEDRSRTLTHQITSGKTEISQTNAAIAEGTAFLGATDAKLDRLGGELAVDEHDLAAATAIRGHEAEVFAGLEKDLMETIDMLQRAITIIEREKNGGASMAQLKSATSVSQALAVLVQASAIGSADASKLTALLQNDDEDAGAPAGSVYVSHSGDILETLSSLLEKAEQQLHDARQTETADQHGFDLMRQGLEDEIKYGKKTMAEAKKQHALKSQAKAGSEGDLKAASAELEADVKAKVALHQACMTKAQDYEAESKSRAEELKALEEAREVLLEKTSGAADLSYSFIQASIVSASPSVLRLVRDLSRKQDSPALAQLASRMESVMKHSSGADGFGKVKSLIRDMIQKLEGEADAEAQEKAWCDRNLADSRESKSNKENEIAKLTTRLDAMSARSSQLKEEIAALQEALAKLAKAQVDMDRIRSEEHALYLANTADMSKGLEGVKMALKILNEYYSGEQKDHDAASGAGTGIIGLLEVIESDFTKGLAEMHAVEFAAQASYEQETKENEIDKTTKDQSVAYKAKEVKQLDVESADLSSDRQTVQTELDAVSNYLAKLESRCIAKAETFAHRKARFEAELAGLKEALRVLESETALVQRQSSRKRALRA